MEAWLAAFRDFDGTSLSILGEDCDQREGEALGTHGRHFMTMDTIFRVFSGTGTSSEGSVDAPLPRPSPPRAGERPGKRDGAPPEGGQ